ncbi:hypothetical protein AAFF_G00124190 [Aldrovandia affinis]|uniref:Uncharacterized protein n=1 Tax=Aldrovandia affinis TaxID=143900 RepID=A0AAD7W9N2_9TELE|nr:hypothetical protein AAFF_G00124190 [Aldrovandia affinis]
MDTYPLGNGPTDGWTDRQRGDGLALTAPEIKTTVVQTCEESLRHRADGQWPSSEEGKNNPLFISHFRV